MAEPRKRSSRINKLVLGPSEPVTARNSHAGMLIIADYIDPMNNQRTLVLERVATDKPKRVAKPAPVAKAS